MYNPRIGYCQGMNFIVGIALLFLEPEDAFWCLVAISEKFFLAHYFDSGLVGAQTDQLCLKHLIELKIPELYYHLKKLDIDISTITLNWFMALFIDALPFETMLRIWDSFLLEGTKVLFRYSLALLYMHKNFYLKHHDTISIFKAIKYSVSVTFDVEELTNIAFNTLKPFPKRREIQQKQKAIFKELTAKWGKKKAADVNGFYEEIENVNDLKISCACFVNNKEIWVCSGKQVEGNVMVANIETRKMVVQNINVSVFA